MLKRYAGMAALVLTFSSAAHADWLFTPSVGTTFGGDTDGAEHRTYSVSFGQLDEEVIGWEADFSYAPDFFAGVAGANIEDSSVLSMMANILVGPELGGKFRPYVTGGVGLMQMRVVSDGGLFEKWHQRHLYEKLGVNGKRAALNRARALGLLGGAAGAAGTTPSEAPAPASSPEPAEAPAPGESPFKGLRHFDEADEGLFFGREALAARLAARLAGEGVNGKPPTRFLAVVGASGSGKSSIVRAGLIPALRHAQAPPFALIHLLTPTAHPLEALAVSLTRHSESMTATATLMDDLARDERTLHLYARRLLNGPGRLLLVVDQFEELFTLCRGEPERQAFIDNLLRATAPAEPDGPLAVVITLRADFYPHCAAYAGLRQALADQQEYIGPMSAGELRQAVERPAALGGWDFEPGLVDLILRDVSDEPGALPLLSHALLETWRHRRGRTLTLRSYAEAGRVQGAIATTAENVFQSMPPEAQASARGIFLRLTELGEGTQDTRRRVPLKELLPSDPGTGGASASGTIASVLQTLSEARLITQDEGAVEVAHEALIREWPTLRQWLSENREGLRLHRRLTEAAQEWESLERDPSELYRGPRLAQAVEWAEWSAHGAEMNPLEREFVAASRALAEREAAEHEAQQQRELEAAQALAAAQSQRAETEARRAAEQTQAATRLRARNRVITAVGVLALLAAIAAGFFGLESNRNAQAAQVANTQSAQNLSAAQVANTQSAQNLGAAQAASTEAIAQRDEVVHLSNVVFANQLATAASQLLSSDYPLAVLLAAEANRIGSGALTRRTLHDILTSSPHLLGFLYGHTDGVNGVAFRPDGKILASGGRDGTIRFWDTATHQPAGTPITASSSVFSVAFSRDGHTLAVGAADGSVRLWDVATGQWRGEPLIKKNGGARALAFSPDGTRLAVGTDNNQVLLWDVATGQPSGRWQTGQQGNLNGLAYSPDSKTIATSSSQDRKIILSGATSGQPLGEPLTMTAAGNNVAFGPDGKTLAAGSGSNVVLWDLSATPPRQLGLLSGPTSDLSSVAFSPDGSLLAAASGDGDLRLWIISTHGQVGGPLAGHRGLLMSVVFSPDGQFLATAGADQTVALWQTSDSLLSLSLDDPVEHACRLAGRNLSHAEWNQYLTGQAYRKTCDQWPEGQ